MLQVKIVYLGGSEQLLSPARGPIQDVTAMSRKVEPVIIKRDVIRSEHDFVSFGFFWILLEDAPKPLLFGSSWQIQRNFP